MNSERLQTLFAFWLAIAMGFLAFHIATPRNHLRLDLPGEVHEAACHQGKEEEHTEV